MNYEEEKESILKKLRKDKNLTQEELANIIEINRVQYNQYENNYVNIPIKHLNSLSNFFDVSIDFLLELTNNKNYKNNSKDIVKAKSGQNLKEFRKENKLTQVELSKLLNTSRTTITEYERGTNYIATPFLYAICKKYNISADYLLGKIDKPKYLK